MPTAPRPRNAARKVEATISSWLDMATSKVSGAMQRARAKSERPYPFSHHPSGLPDAQAPRPVPAAPGPAGPEPAHAAADPRGDGSAARRPARRRDHHGAPRRPGARVDWGDL